MAAKASSATSAEDSSMLDLGECSGCVKGERGGMRHDLHSSIGRCRSHRTQSFRRRWRAGSISR